MTCVRLLFLCLLVVAAIATASLVLNESDGSSRGPSPPQNRSANRQPVTGTAPSQAYDTRDPRIVNPKSANVPRGHAKNPSEKTIDLSGRNLKNPSEKIIELSGRNPYEDINVLWLDDRGNVRSVTVPASADEYIKVLQKLITETNPILRAGLIQSIGYWALVYRDQSAITTLNNFARNDPAENVRLTAIRSLSTMRQGEFYLALSAVRENDNASVRAEAVKILGEQLDKGFALGYLDEAYNTEARLVGTSRIPRALLEKYYEERRERLLTLLKEMNITETSDRVRSAIITILEEYGDR